MVFWRPHPLSLFAKQKPTVQVGLCFWWERVESNHLSQRQQIYSLPRLSDSGARPKLFTHAFATQIHGASRGNRTLISSLEGLHSSL